MHRNRILQNIFVFFAILIFVFSFGAKILAKDNFFTDTLPSHPNFAAITALRNAGTIQGFPDNTFVPDKLVNRAESLKVILLGSNVEMMDPPLRPPFPDVQVEDWFSAYVRVAKQNSIIQGTKEGNFEPMRTVNQAEALKIILLTNKIPADSPLSDPFEGKISKDEWFAPHYELAETWKLLTPEEVNPTHELTRGELVEIMYRFHEGEYTYSYPIGIVSYYGDGANGSNTASGGVFDNNAFVAAHRTLDFGTHVLVRDVMNGTAVVVKVIDRGPYVPYRNLDLSKAAFSALTPPSQGLTKAELVPVSADVPLGPVAKICDFPEKRETIAVDGYAKIYLENQIPRLFRKNESIHISGTAENGDIVTIFWEGDGNMYREIAPIENGNFSKDVTFSKEGDFTLGIILGQSGESVVYPISVLDKYCFVGEGEQPNSPENVQGNIVQGDYVLSWEDENNNFFRILFTQQEKTTEFFVNNAHTFTVDSNAFKDFQSGIAEVRIFSAKTSSSFSMDISTPFSAPVKKEIILSDHFFYDEDLKKLTSYDFPKTFTKGDRVRFSGTFLGKIQDKGFVTRPGGSVDEIPLIMTDQKFVFNFVPDIVGTYIVEVNADDGIAILNVPLYHQDFAPVLPDFFDANPPKQVTGEAASQNGERKLKKEELMLVNLVNAAREESGLSKLEIDENLSELAAFRSQDMKEKDYFAHVNPEGKSVNDFLVDFGVKTKSVGENLAIDQDYEFAHEGLMRSPGHRKNILNPDWGRIGIGIAELDNQIVVTELFSIVPLTNSETDTYSSKVIDTINSSRTTELISSDSLNDVAKKWAEKMRDEKFFGGESPSGETIIDFVRKNGVTSAVMTGMYQYAMLSEFLTGLKGETDTKFVFEEKWKNIGIGILVDDLGILTAVILVSP
ncbi:S-layer homology domain-containing protein [Candidatus Peregrinibacteria bacterium]|nr:S-layer homology domain-containing protein [Candidatus Peregrinibacteria bacterium]